MIGGLISSQDYVESTKWRPNVCLGLKRTAKPLGLRKRWSTGDSTTQYSVLCSCSKWRCPRRPRPSSLHTHTDTHTYRLASQRIGRARLYKLRNDPQPGPRFCKKPVLLMKKPQAIKKKTNAKMSLDFSEDMFIVCVGVYCVRVRSVRAHTCVCISTVCIETTHDCVHINYVIEHPQRGIY